MADDRITQLKFRAQQANRKYALLREGVEPEITDVLGVVRWRPQRQAVKRGEAGADNPIPFHVPMTRAHRLATAAGVTSFHFAHSFINKVSTERMEDGRRNRPGAARAHGKYVERETAVANLTDAVDPAIAASFPIERAITADASPDAPSPAADLKENEHEREEKDGVAAGRAGGRSEGTDAGRPFLQRQLEILGDFAFDDDAESDADLRLLSGFELVRRKRQPGLFLQGVATASVDTGEFLAAVRQPRSRQGRHDGAKREVAAQTPSGHDRYIVRGGAVAIQPDGGLALFTNIDADPAKRAEFWTLVEEHERSAGEDQMSCRFADRAAFWAEAVRHPDCPPALRKQHARADHDQLVRFDIDSGKAMRTFLKRQIGWIDDGKRRRGESNSRNDDSAEPFADFHDGRAGRTQYRIVGELPSELSMAGRVNLLRGYTEEFRRRRIPFVAVMHAPDHNNDEKNWHFHIVYYDRPCARITAAQIAELERNGHDTGRLRPGMWDFAAATVKRDRVNRELWPLRQKKLAQVGNDRWIIDLRRRFAEQTNAQLEKAGVTRRVDPRSHADMGIVADPQEHLGTRQAAAETRGTVTAAGTRNEERQSQAILTQIDETRAKAYADATRRAADWKRRLAGRPTGEDEIPLAEVEQNLIAAADLDHVAASLRHADDRAASRATNLKRMNGQLVQAIDADASAGSRRERQRRADIVAGADGCLHILDVALRDDRRLAADCTAEAERLRGVARLAEGRLAELVNAPVVVPEPAIATEALSSSASADPIEQWLRRVEERRPLIVKDPAGFSLAGIKPPTDIAVVQVQTRLGTLYRRQQQDIVHVVRQLPAHRLSLNTRTIDGRSRRQLADVDPELASAFFRYQDSPEIKAALQAIFTPGPSGRSGVGSATRPPAPHSPTAPARDATAFVSPSAAPVPPEPRPAPAMASNPSTPAPLIERAITPPINEPVVPPMRSVVKAQERPQPVPQKILDPAQVARDIVASKVPLTFDEEDRIDRAALLAAKVDASIIGALQVNPFLAGRVGLQVDAALARLQAHAKLKPLNLIRKDGRITLGGDAPAELIELSRFHSQAPRMQDRLLVLYDDLNRPVVVEQPHQTVSPRAIEPHQNEVAQAQESVQPAAPADPDILHGDAARRAAQRAAWQRGQ